MEIVAISFALHSFVTQAFTALEIHRYSLQIYHPVTPGIGWLFFDMFLWFILVATFILLVAALSLLTSHKIARGLGLIISTLLLVSDLGRVLTQIFLSSRELTIVLGISSAMSIYYLWKSH